MHIAFCLRVIRFKNTLTDKIDRKQYETKPIIFVRKSMNDSVAVVFIGLIIILFINESNRIRALYKLRRHYIHL